MSMNRSAVLVTGGAGYIGSHVCKALSDSGYLPVVLDNFRTGNRWAVRWGPLETGTTADEEFVRTIVQKHQITACIHLAGAAYVGESVGHPDLYWRENVVTTATLLDSLANVGVKKIVFSSSCTVYSPTSQALSESNFKSPINPYGRTKLAVEWMLEDRARANQLSYVALRYFNAAGADPDGEIGEWHDPEPHLIPAALLAAGQPSRTLQIHGTDYPTRDGSCIRDFIHVTDIAQAHVLALGYLLKENSSRAFNLGSGSGYSVKEVIDMCRKIAGDINVCEGPRRVGDAAMLVASPEQAISELDWVPMHSNLEEIIRTAWAWLQKYQNGEVN